jgi:hypothetical protein
MSLIVGSIIIFIGLIIHAVINYISIMSMQRDSARTQRFIQERHHQHEVEFAKEQQRIFREGVK